MISIEQILNEELNTDSRDIFFVGCKYDTYDLSKQKFISYKTFSRLNTESSAFGTSTLEYAIAYAIQYSKKDKPGILVAFKLNKGLRFFELKNINDYKKISGLEGLEDQLALIFKECEPYFAINTKVDGHRLKAVPTEYNIAREILKFRVFGKFEGGITSLLISKTLDNDKFKLIDDSEYKSIYEEYAKNAIRNAIGKKAFEKNETFIKTTKLTREQLYGLKNPDYGKEINGKTVRFGTGNGFDKYDNFIKNVLLKKYPKSIENTPLFNNYKIMYKDQNRMSPIENFDLVNAYLVLFKLLNFYINQKYNENGDDNFSRGINKIKEWLKSNRDSDEVTDDLEASESRSGKSSHVYIDILQYVFFTILTSNKLIDGSDNPYVGVYSPEFKGYAEINHSTSKTDDNNEFREIQPYGYAKKISASTICYDDKTIIITKPIYDNVECCGYPIDQFLDLQYNTVAADAKDEDSFIDDEGKRVKWARRSEGDKVKEKVKSKKLVKVIQDQIKDNAHLSIQEFKSIIDSLLNDPEVKGYDRSYALRTNLGLADREYHYPKLFVDKKQKEVNWMLFWTKDRLAAGNDKIKTLNNKAYSYDDVLKLLGIDCTYNDIELCKKIPRGLTGGPYKSVLATSILDFIVEQKNLLDISDEKVKEIESLPKNGSYVDIKNDICKKMIMSLPINNDLKQHLVGDYQDDNISQSNKTLKNFPVFNVETGEVDPPDNEKIKVKKSSKKKIQPRELSKEELERIEAERQRIEFEERKAKERLEQSSQEYVVIYGKNGEVKQETIISDTQANARKDFIDSYSSLGFQPPFVIYIYNSKDADNEDTIHQVELLVNKYREELEQMEKAKDQEEAKRKEDQSHKDQQDKAEQEKIQAIQAQKQEEKLKEQQIIKNTFSNNDKISDNAQKFQTFGLGITDPSDKVNVFYILGICKNIHEKQLKNMLFQYAIKHNIKPFVVNNVQAKIEDCKWNKVVNKFTDPDQIAIYECIVDGQAKVRNHKPLYLFRYNNRLKKLEPIKIS